MTIFLPDKLVPYNFVGSYQSDIFKNGEFSVSVHPKLKMLAKVSYVARYLPTCHVNGHVTGFFNPNCSLLQLFYFFKRTYWSLPFWDTLVSGHHLLQSGGFWKPENEQQTQKRKEHNYRRRGEPYFFFTPKKPWLLFDSIHMVFHRFLFILQLNDFCLLELNMITSLKKFINPQEI